MERWYGELPRSTRVRGNRLPAGAKRPGVCLAALVVALAGRTGAAQQIVPPVLGADVRARYSGDSHWERGIAEAVTDSGLVLRQARRSRFLRRDSIAYIERREGKDRAAIIHVAIAASALGFIIGEHLGGGNRNDVAGAVGSAYGGLLGAGTAAVAGGLIGLRFVPDRWSPIDVGLVFRR